MYLNQIPASLVGHSATHGNKSEDVILYLIRRIVFNMLLEIFDVHLAILSNYEHKKS
jgi:hypothetical protein